MRVIDKAYYIEFVGQKNQIPKAWVRGFDPAGDPGVEGEAYGSGGVPLEIEQRNWGSSFA